MASKCKVRQKKAAVQTRSAATSSRKASAKKPAAASQRSVQRVPAKQVTKVSSQKGTKVAVTGTTFRGAKYVEITENAISVTHAASRSRKGSFEQVERRRYLPQTPKTIAAANAALDEATRAGKVKKIRVEFK